ncbi:MAG: hypothetical protein ABI947_12255 [Chloroflexota bacterium]
MGDERLRTIQSLQFTDRAGAEALLLGFVRETFPDLDSVAIELRPLAVSLNSFNGFLTLANGRKLFFKTHVEPDSIVGEYYNSTLLAEAGYPIIKPLYASTEYGKQFLIYDLIDSPSVFDVAHAIERGERDDLVALTAAQNRADDDLLRIYLSTLAWQSAEDAAKAPIHQLFHHRLGARYQEFYGGKAFELPQGISLTWDDLLDRQWAIIGVDFHGSLRDAIHRANVDTIRPDRAYWSVIGHGDAHNGNVFARPEGLVYFDPAFGGRHNPLLDLTKPLFHNVFATWMYHPHEVAESLQIEFHDDGTYIRVMHNYRLSACREMFLESKVQRVLLPLAVELARRDPPPDTADPRSYIRETLKAALMCCPLLTMNLADRQRFPPEVGLLGLCFVIEMGLESGANDSSRSIIDSLLDKIR